jgi:hypothetical protein
MKKTLAMLAGACFALGLLMAVPTVSHAQAASGPFADVPADHWAYQAVDTLQRAGIVIGYPDGTYGGKRAMTRYEFAVAIARLLPLIKAPDLSDYATKEDLSALSDDLNAKLAANQAALDALKALVDQFQPELTQLGQDVADVRQRLDALEGRVAAVEEEQRRVKITGELDVIALGAVGTTGNGTGVDANQALPGSAEQPVVDVNGAVQDPTGTKHILQTDSVDENFALNIRGRVSDTATANVKLDYGDYLPAIGNTSAVATSGYIRGPGPFPAGQFTYGYGAPGYFGGFNPGATNQDAVSLREAYFDAPVSLGPLGDAELDAGRIPVQFDKFTLEEPDADQYTWLYETDSGNVPFDGGKLALKVGPVKVQAFGGTETSTPFSELYAGSQNLQAGVRPTGDILDNHAAPITQGGGVRASFGSPDSIEVAATLEEFGLGASDSPIPGATPTNIDPEASAANATNSKYSYNKLTVYEGSINGILPIGIGPIKKGGIGVDLSYGESLDGGLNNNADYAPTGSATTVGKREVAQYNENEEQLKVQVGPVNLEGGYQFVGPYYSAPGYWGTMGAWTNPTNVKGGVVSANVNLTSKLGLNAGAQFYDPAYGGSIASPEPSPLQQGDKVDHYQVAASYNLNSSYDINLGYDAVEWNLSNDNHTLNPATNAAGAITGYPRYKPTESYITFGIGHSFNSNASLKLLYQIIQYNDKSSGFDQGVGNGNLALGQFSVKF